MQKHMTVLQKVLSASFNQKGNQITLSSPIPVISSKKRHLLAAAAG